MTRERQMSSSAIDLQALGFSQEELQERVIDRICEQVMSSTYLDDEGYDVSSKSSFARKLEAKVKEQVDATISALAEKHVLPNVAQYIENLTLQQTNEWGEKRGEPVSFIEYLVQRAESYLNEKVDHDGKAKGESSYNWRGDQTRITYLVNAHLQYSISTAMKKAMEAANGQIARGIHETVRLKLNEVAAQLNAKAGK